MGLMANMNVRCEDHSGSSKSWREGRRPVWPFASAIVLCLVGLGVVVLSSFENRLIYFPDRQPLESWKPAGLRFEDAEFEAADGTRLHGWYFDAPDPRAVVLFAHGNGGNVTYCADTLDMLRERHRVAILGFDYRGYGLSQGMPDEPGVMADARAARAWLARRAGVNERQVVLMGTSLGGAVMVDLAANDGCRGLILESTFCALRDVAAHHYPLLPVRWLMRTSMDSRSKIARYAGPLLQCHSTTDEIVPFALGRRLFDAANEPKTFVELNGLGHNAPLPEEYYLRLDEFIEALPKPATGV